MRSRRARVLACLIAASVLLAAAGAWALLPRLAPGLVIRHSPFLEPVVRAVAAQMPLPAATPAEGWPARGVDDPVILLADSRLAGADASDAAMLRRCLASADPAVRLQALRLLRMVDPPGPAELARLAGDPDPWLRLAAWELLMRADGFDLFRRVPHWLHVTYPLTPGESPGTVARPPADWERTLVEVALVHLRGSDGWLRERVVQDIAEEPERFTPARDRLLAPFTASEPGLAERLRAALARE
jgi:hypothetical protein